MQEAHDHGMARTDGDPVNQHLTHFPYDRGGEVLGSGRRTRIQENQIVIPGGTVHGLGYQSGIVPHDLEPRCHSAHLVDLSR
jgi:hypothetical protein